MIQLRSFPVGGKSFFNFDDTVEPTGIMSMKAPLLVIGQNRVLRQMNLFIGRKGGVVKVTLGDVDAEHALLPRRPVLQIPASTFVELENQAKKLGILENTGKLPQKLKKPHTTKINRIQQIKPTETLLIGCITEQPLHESTGDSKYWLNEAALVWTGGMDNGRRGKFIDFYPLQSLAWESVQPKDLKQLADNFSAYDVNGALGHILVSENLYTQLFDRREKIVSNYNYQLRVAKDRMRV